jgi:hypothetical protein
VEGISSRELEKLAYSTGLIKRVARKIDVIDFLTLMCLESQKGSPSYNDLAARFETTYKQNPSKQAVSKKINPACILFFQSVLACVIKSKLPKSELELLKNGNFNRILVQDSTILKLPRRLFKIFSGVSNGHAAVCNTRIQGVYNLLSGRFISFSIDTYTKNDFLAAPELELCKGDLTLRDRGYFTKGEVNRHIEVGADFIYRYKHKTIFYDPKTRKEINLSNLLKGKASLDMEVCMNEECNLKVRLIAVVVSADVASMRRRKAKKESNGHNPSAELLGLMAWTIFITTIPIEQADFHKIFMIYGLRWRIEIIFKSWKSHMQFAKLHNVSENQLRVILTARFIMIVIYMQNIYYPCFQRIYFKYKRSLSLLKLLNYLMKNPEKMMEVLYINAITNETIVNEIDKSLIRYCTYDGRLRLNFSQMLRLALT